MKALVYTKYGSPDVLQIKEIEKPIPNDDEVLVKIYATTVNRTDCATIRAKPFFARVITGLFKPNKEVPGTEFSGIVDSVGKNAADFMDQHIAEGRHSGTWKGDTRLNRFLAR